MGLFPQSFIEDLRLQADIVQVIQDHVSLRRAGAGYKGLCPFHAEKTPSFHVNRDRGFFHCFGCGVGGDVFKFVELHEKVGFQEAVQQVAQRAGLSVPRLDSADRNPEEDAARETLLKIHDVAAGYFREQLEAPSGARARRLLQQRGLDSETIGELGIGLAPGERAGLTTFLLGQGFGLPLLLKSGLVVDRGQGPGDRFRRRLMIPICRERGPVIAFGGRALDADQQPKYLNSPETPIYSKGRVLYGLHLAKSALRHSGYVVVVEGYFDLAQVRQAGVQSVVATCGTALTTSHAQVLRRFVRKVVLNFDPDGAGHVAAARSCDLLVREGFQVNVVVLPAGEDPDTFVRRQGGSAYVEQLRRSRSYLEYLLDRAAVSHDLGTDDGRRGFLSAMLEVAGRIPDRAARDQFADRVAHRARITEEVVRAEIRRAAVEQRTELTPRELPGFGNLKPAEKGLIWAVVHAPASGLDALASLENGDLEDLRAGPILLTARSLVGWPTETLPRTLLERLNEKERQLVEEIAGDTVPPAAAGDCARAIKRLSYEREQASVQRKIDRLQELGTQGHSAEIDKLWQRKKNLLQEIEALNA